MQAQLLKYSDHCFQSLANNQISVGEDCTIESVHKLRLSIKRLRALLKILDYADGSSKKAKLLKRIDSVFLLSGNLRDVQVQIDLLRIYRNQVGGVVDELISALGKEEKRVARRHKSEITKIDPFDVILLNQRLDNAIEVLDDRMIDNILRTKADGQISQIIQISSGNLDEHKLHRIRVILRELIYTLSIMRKGRPQLNYTSPFILPIKNLQQKLGKWHDLKVLLDRLVQADYPKLQLVHLLRFIEADKHAIRIEVIDDLMNLKLVKRNKRGN